jgi:hypothetical protein
VERRLPMWFTEESSRVIITIVTGLLLSSVSPGSLGLTRTSFSLRLLGLEKFAITDWSI